MLEVQLFVSKVDMEMVGFGMISNIESRHPSCKQSFACWRKLLPDNFFSTRSTVAKGLTVITHSKCQIKRAMFKLATGVRDLMSIKRDTDFCSNL